MVGMNATSVSVVGSRQVPAAPLLDDPLPVLDHFFGQTNYPAQGAAGEKRRQGSTNIGYLYLTQEELQWQVFCCGGKTKRCMQPL